MGPDSTSSTPSSASTNNSTSSLSTSNTTSTLASLSGLGGLSGSATLPRSVNSSCVSLKLPLTERELNRGVFQHHLQLTQSFPGGTGTPVSPTTAVILANGGVVGGGGEPMSVPLAHKNPNHASNAFDALNKMRQSNQLCDVTINVGGVSIPGHKVVLAAALLPASSLLQMSLVREACCKFLLRQLHPTNCLGIRNFADTHACKELQTRSHRFALQNFPEVMNTEEFVMLPLEEVEELLGSNQLNVTNEEQAYAAVMAWVKHDADQRRSELSRLLSKVRVPLLSRRFLMTVVDSEGLIRDDAGCKDLLLEAMRYHLLPEQRASLSSERTIERKPDGMRPYIFAIGGGSLFAIHSECECYNPRTDRWAPVAPLLTRRSRCGVASVGRLLYAVGGYDGTSDLATAETYNPRSNKWSGIAPMGTRRSCLGLCSLDGLMYAVGGYDGASCLNSVERYDPLTGVWSCCPALSQRRRYCRLTSLDGCVWAVGGLDASNAIAAVERLDPREGKWVSVPALSQRRSSAGLAALDGNLYCVGGSDGSACLATAEKFDPRRLRWESIASMHTRRSTHELVSVDGALFALGGNDGSSSLSTVEKYDPRLNKWILLNAMLTRRSSLGGAVLDCLPMDRPARPC
ncbi:unnamed protein product [Allacma fusca]|uniref:BACK domain-containing protein n=1 Tax=Allacma fusca TaxID=39272 RepID=A0A8J2NJ95_9HEXA|nr:unnamed protein product [Allacma fusca]